VWGECRVGKGGDDERAWLAVDGGRRELGAALGDLPSGSTVETVWEGETETSRQATVVPAAAALAGFLTSCRARGLSPITVAWYEGLLGAFVRAHPDLPLGPATIEGFLGALSGSDATRHAYFRCLRVFYRWLAAREGLASPMEGLRPPRLRRRPPVVLGLPQVRRVMAAAMTRRDKALLALLFDTGIRLGEAHGLTWSAVGEETIVVVGKTGRREVPISAWTRSVLLLGVDLPWRGQKGELTLNGVYQAVRRCLRRAGVEKGGPHLLRHSFARQYVLNGGDVFSLQRIMGHRDLSTTRIYVDMDVADLVAQHRRFSPIVRLLEEAAG